MVPGRHASGACLIVDSSSAHDPSKNLVGSLTTPLTTRTTQRYMIATSLEEDAYESPDELLEVRGDWQAYFDADQYGLIYYFNIKTGVSQWDAPDNFPVPTLSEAQLELMQAKKREQSESSSAQQQSPPVQESPSRSLSSTPSTFDVLGGILTTVFKGLTQEENNKSQQPTDTSSDNTPWWSFLTESKSSSAQSSSKQNGPANFFAKLFGNEQQPSEPQPSKTETLVSHVQQKKQISSPSLLNDLTSLFQVDATRPSRPLSVPPLGMMAKQQPHDSDILQILSEDDPRKRQLTKKRYADSRKRQENLRRNYESVEHNRSPTISLSQLKRENKAGWHQYLDD